MAEDLAAIKLRLMQVVSQSMASVVKSSYCGFSVSRLTVQLARAGLANLIAIGSANIIRFKVSKTRKASRSGYGIGWRFGTLRKT